MSASVHTSKTQGFERRAQSQLFWRAAGARDTRRLPFELQQRFQELKAEYRLIAGATAVPDVVSDVLRIDSSAATLPDLFVLERGYAAALPDAFVPGAIQLWRSTYRGIVGESAFADYLATKPLDPGASDVRIDRLRADLAWLIERVHYLFTVGPACAAVQNRISWRLAAVSGLIFCALGAYAIYRAHGGGPMMATLNILLAIVFFGVLGGFISALMRIQSATGVDPFFKKVELYQSQWIVMILSPIEGGIFALILYMIFASGLLNGSIFPSFTGTTSNVTIGHFLEAVLPQKGTDLALLFVWSFIAGFAERLVPDVLSRFATDTAVTGTKRA